MMDDIEQNTQDQMAVMRQHMMNTGELYAHTFDTPTGKKVLAHLTAMTYGSSLNSNDMMDANAKVSATEFMCMREGQDSVIRYINRIITFYKENK